MKLDSQLKLQAYLDGELSAREVRQVETWLAEDNEVRLLLAELQNTKAALASDEPDLKLPESREFYWNKIESEIQRQSQTRPQTGIPFIFASWGKFLIPATAVAALVALALIIVSPSRHSTIAQAIARHFHEFESPSEDAHGFTFRDQTTGTTVVWITYADDEGFTDTGLIDSIQ
jgi:anti-sigma-K factor RskA